MNEGEYVRLEDGTIFKADENTANYYNSNKEYITNEVTKHSENIVDLIEIGDYVNGSEVQALKGDIRIEQIGDEDDVLYTSYDSGHDEWFGCHKDEIKSIVTKELLKDIEYTVE